MPDRGFRRLTSTGPKVLVGVTVILSIASLAAIIFLIWVSVTVNSYQENRQEQDLANMRQLATQIGDRLRDSSLDGRLTDAEIDRAVLQYAWHADRRSPEVRIVVRVQASTPVGSRCFTYAFPSLSGASPARTETASCPEVTYHPELSKPGPESTP